LCVASLTHARNSDDWPSWRGPNRNGITADPKLSNDTLANGANIRWTASLGNGYSSVAVSDGQLYTMGNIDDQDVVYRLATDTGKEVWRYTYDAKAGSYKGPRSTPVVDGPYVYTLSQHGDLICLDKKQGKVKWRENILRNHGIANTKWGLSASPCIEGDLVILNAGTSGIALNKSTGATVWSTGTDCGGYAAPVIYERAGKRLAAIFGQKAIYGVDVKTGRVEWQWPWETKYDVNAADPIYADGKVFISSGYGRGCALLNISSGEPSKLWENRTLKNHFSSSILLNNHIFGIDGNTGGGHLRCSHP